MKAFGLSETGPVRRMNEDCFVSAEDLRLFVVADGMGGHAAGEVAARVAVESIENFIRRSHETTDFSWPYGIDPTLSYEANRLKTAVSLANRRINRLAEDHDDYLGMGTTVVCALLSDGHLIVAHVGDSRLYLCDGDELIQLTQDDSWAATVLGGKDGNERLSGDPSRPDQCSGRPARHRRCICSSASCRGTRHCCCAATVCTGRCLTKRCGTSWRRTRNCRRSHSR